MKKVLIFSIIFVLIVLFSSSIVLASDIDMNLTSNSSVDSTVYGSDNINMMQNTGATNNSMTNYAEPSTTTDDTYVPQASTSTTIPDTTISVGSTSALSSSNLTFSNILSIILIVLGILLVLFAIAILLRIR